MALKQVYICDRCGAEVDSNARTFIPTGRSTTPAGDAEDDGEHVDICLKCRSAALTKFVLSLRDYSRNKEFLAWAKSKIRLGRERV